MKQKAVATQGKRKLVYSEKRLKAALLRRLRHGPVFVDELPVCDYPKGVTELRGDLELVYLYELERNKLVVSRMVVKPDKDGRLEGNRRFELVDASDWSREVKNSLV